MADVEVAAEAGNGKGKINFTIVDQVAYTRKLSNFAPYDHCVAMCVERLTNTRAVIWKSHRGGAVYCSMKFVGEQTDAQLASELHLIILDGVRKAARQQYGSGWSNAHTSYAIGFGQRLADRAKDMQDVPLTPAEQTTMALVIRGKDEAINQWLADTGVREGKRRRGGAIDPWAYNMGYQDGARYNLTTRRTLRGHTG
jgi:hypothetical protein